MGLIKLKSSDSKLFEVDRGVLKMFKTIEEMLVIIGLDEGNIDVIPLKQVDSKILEIILKWAESYRQHQQEQQLLNTTPPNELYDFEREHIDKYHEIKFEIINAANYLGVDELSELWFMTLAKQCSATSTNPVHAIGDNSKGKFTRQQK